MRKQHHHVWVFIFGGLVSLLLAGCAADVGKTIKISDEQVSKYGTLSAADAVAVLAKRVDSAKNAYMPYYAPDYYRGASEILSDVQKAPEKKPKNELISTIAKADAILDKGEAMMAVVQSRLANEFALKNQLDKDNAPKVYPKQYENAINDLASLVKKVELEKADSFDKDKAELDKMMQALDVKTIQYTALHESDVINEDTKSKDGDDNARATLDESLRVYLDAANRIAQAPHDEVIVQRAGADALFAARHARYVNERVMALQIQFKKAIEPVVLEEEKGLLDISTALGQADQRDQPVDKQAEKIALAAGELTQGQQKTKQTIGAATEQNKAFEKRLKDANDAMQKSNDAANAQLAGKDAQIKSLNDQVAQLVEQNRALTEAAAPKPKSKTKAKAAAK